MSEQMGYKVGITKELLKKITEQKYGNTQMTQNVVRCMLAKLGKDAEDVWSEEYDAQGFQAYADPDNIEEGESKMTAFVFFKKDDEDDVTASNGFVLSKNEAFAHRVAKFLEECGDAKKTGSGRRKARKTRKTRKNRKAKKQTRRR